MRDLCNTDKPLFAVLTKLTYSAYLNILWLVCSLPIVTIGASTTALFYVAQNGGRSGRWSDPDVF